MSRRAKEEVTGGDGNASSLRRGAYLLCLPWLLFSSMASAHSDWATRRAAAKVLPAVVFVETVAVSYSRDGEEKSSRSGTGMIYRRDGYVITNEHVIRDSLRVHCVMQDGRRLKAEIVGRHTDSDVAVLRLLDVDERLPVVHFGNPARLKAGDTVLVVGNPKRMRHSVTMGIVSHPSRYFRRAFDSTRPNFGGLYHWVQTDSVIEPGSSGSPVVTLKGDVIGMAARHTGEDLGMAIPGDYVHAMAERLREEGRSNFSEFGWSLQSLDQATMAEPDGVVISHVRRGSAADESGIRTGDILLRVGTEKTHAPREQDIPAIRRTLAWLPPEVDYEAEIRRNGELFIRTVRPHNEIPGNGRFFYWKAFGFAVQEMSVRIRNLFSHPGPGLRVAGVKNYAPAHRAGMKFNDILNTVDGIPVTSLEELRAAYEECIKSPGAQTRVSVLRDTETIPLYLIEKRARPEISQGEVVPGTDISPVPVQIDARAKRLDVQVLAGHESHLHPTAYQFQVLYRTISNTGLMIRPGWPLIVTDTSFRHLQGNRTFYVYWPGGAKTRGRIAGQLRGSSLAFIKTEVPKNLPKVTRTSVAGSSMADKAWFKQTPPTSAELLTGIRDRVRGRLLQYPNSSNAHFMLHDELLRTEGIVYDSRDRWQGLIVPSAPPEASLMVPAERIQAMAEFFDGAWAEPGQRSWLGLNVRPLDPVMAAEWALFNNEVVVTRVVEDSPAASAGFRLGDIVKQVNGSPLIGKAETASLDFEDMMTFSSPGRRVEFKVSRKTEDLVLTAVLEPAPPSMADLTPVEIEAWGAQVVALTPDVSERLLLPRDTNGLLISSLSEGEANVAGLDENDVILTIDGQPATMDLVSEIVDSPDKTRLLFYYRSGLTRFTKIPR